MGGGLLVVLSAVDRWTAWTVGSSPFHRHYGA